MLQDQFYPSSNIGALANRSIEIAAELMDNTADHFKNIKTGNNQAARQALPAARDFIESGKSEKDVFERACALAAAGNVAPIGLPTGIFKFEDVENILNERDSWPTFQGDVHEAAKKSSHVLYLCDNSGEIGFDSLLLEKLKEMGKKISIVVKESHFFEDATRKDLSFFELDGMVDDVFSINGFFVPDEIQPALRKAFEACDLVICKGTGNYEGLADETEGKATIFMLKIKCGPIARKVGLEVGSFVVRLDV
jgi:uncharacterized protein with ATP-grasp and redox domains